MNKSKITDKSFAFAVRIVKLCVFLEKQGCVSRTLANQLLRSGTSIVKTSQTGSAI